MSNSSVPQAGRAAPPWRALAWLAALVLAAHALLLQTSPRRDVPAPDPSLRHAPAFVTRRIEMPPPAQVTAAPAVASVKVRPVTKPKQILKEKMAVAKEPRAQSAIDFIANDEPGPIFASDPYASIRLDSEPDPASAAANDAAATTAATAAAEAPLAAASAASADPASAAPPAGPLQTPVTALALPASSRLQYRMDGSAKGLTYHASAELIWHNEGGSYDARMTVSALFLGSRSMASRGQVSADGLAPTRFSDKSRSELAAHFEPDKGRISFSANTPPAPWVRGAQDRLSVFLQLGGLLAGSPASYPVGASISMYTVGRRDADSWTFVVEAGEKLDLPYGELDTLKLSRQPRREFDQKVEIWYAPALGYLPVRSKITQHNGDFVDQQLNTLTPL